MILASGWGGITTRQYLEQKLGVPDFGRARLDIIGDLIITLCQARGAYPPGRVPALHEPTGEHGWLAPGSAKNPPPKTISHPVERERASVRKAKLARPFTASHCQAVA
jgi:hypothetical protein